MFCILSPDLGRSYLAVFWRAWADSLPESLAPFCSFVNLSFLFFGEWMGYTFLLLLGLISVLREFALPASLCLGVGLGAFRGRWTPYQ